MSAWPAPSESASALLAVDPESTPLDSGPQQEVAPPDHSTAGLVASGDGIPAPTVATDTPFAPSEVAEPGSPADVPAPSASAVLTSPDVLVPDVADGGPGSTPPTGASASTAQATDMGWPSDGWTAPGASASDVFAPPEPIAPSAPSTVSLAGSSDLDSGSPVPEVVAPVEATTPETGAPDTEPDATTPPTGRRARPPVAPPQPSTAGSFASMVTRFAALAWCWLIAWGLLWSLVPLLVGWSPTVVTSGSMEPSLAVGDVVHIDESANTTSLGVGTVIAFDDPGLPGMRVTHRITGVEIEGDEIVGYRTKGDANEVADSTIVPVESVYGVGRLVVPYAGLPRVWASDGRWIHLSGFVLVTMISAVLAGDTIQQYLTGRPRRRRRKQLAGIAVAIAAMLGAPTTTAAFTAATDNVANNFSMTPTWYLDTVDRNNPIAHWRLGEPNGGPPVTVMTDDFETFTGWNTHASIGFVSSTAQAHGGTRSGSKTGNNESKSAWKLLPSPVNGGFVLDVWVYRPSGGGGGTIDSIGLEDSSNNGYSFMVSHDSNTLGIGRRDGGAATTIGTPAVFDPPEDAWYRLELQRTGSSIVVDAYDEFGSLLASASTTDPTTSSWNRVAVHGRRQYYVDDLRVDEIVPTTVAVDRIATLDGTYVGGPTLAVPGLVNGQPDTAADLDGIDDAVLIGDSPSINLATISERTTELWFEADSTSGRQVLYEEGGTGDGKNIYLDGTTLYATAWGDSLGWSNDLVTSTTVAPNTTYHVAVTLDAVGTRSLTLYFDGVPVSTATKTDSAQWNAHSDDGAIGYINGGTRFHDGNSSGTGTFPFDGTVDEVALYNGIVPAADIANHHTAGI